MSNTSLNNNQEEYKCGICSLSFPYLHSLRVHLRDVHKGCGKCGKCGGRLPSRSHVKKQSTENAKGNTALLSKHASFSSELPVQCIYPVKNVSQTLQTNQLTDLKNVHSNSKQKKLDKEVTTVPTLATVFEAIKSASQKVNDDDNPEAVRDLVCIPEEYLMMEFKQEEETDNFLYKDSSYVPNTSDTGLLNNNDISVNYLSSQVPLESGNELTVTEIIEILKVEVNNEEIVDEGSLPHMHAESKKNGQEVSINETESVPDLLLMCSLCGKAFPDDISLAAHESLHDKEPLSDGDENKSDDDQDLRPDSESQDYLSKLKGTGEFTCDKCLISFPRQNMLKMHAFKIHGDKSFQCLICGEKCPTRQSLTKHKQIHVVDGAFKCETCGVSQAKYSNFLRHLKLHSGTRDYTCEWCGQSFTTSTVLIRHRRRHTGEKPYSCDECGKRFARLYGLRVHQSKHVGRTYFCTEENCSKGFYAKSALNNHMKSHLPDRPYKCMECGCGFYMSSNYKDHVRKHTGEKPFLCEVCNKSFARKAELIVHARVHTGEKPFDCSCCNKPFSSLTALKQHSKTHLTSKDSKCKDCEQIFKNKGALKRHMKCAHNPDSSDESFTLHLSEEENSVDSPENATENI